LDAIKSKKPITFQSIKIYSRAFGVAILLWIFVVSNNEYEILFDFPIEARNLNSQKAHKKELPPFITAKIGGVGRDLFKALIIKKYSGFKLVLDLESVSQEYEFSLNDYFKKYPEKVVIPSKYNINFIEIIYPNKIKISLDDYDVKIVPVISNIIINPSPGHTQVSNIEISPMKIEIAGPKEELILINHVETIFDTLNNLKNPNTFDIDIRSLGKLINFSVQKVNVFLDIQEISERIISDIPVQVINIPNNIRVFPSPQTVSLTIVGGYKRISNITSDEIKIIIDFNNWNHLNQFYEPLVNPPSNIIEWRDLSPKNLEIGVARELK
jgi:YbbR domain-containing protein